MANGRYHAAASAFASLAGATSANGMPVRAALLGLQSARALLAAGQVEAAEGRARTSLMALIAAGLGRRAAELLPRVASDFRAGGHDPQAESLAAEIKAALSGAGPSAPAHEENHTARPAVLPTRCRSCGAPVFRDEVAWHDAVTASCAYCGSAIRAT
jgi:hypothetical protein